MNKINQNIDFIFASKNDYVANLEQNSPLTPLNIYECKSSLFDLDYMGLESTPHQFIYDLNNDPSIISLNDLQDSKKIDLEYEIFNKNLDTNQIEEKNDIKDINLKTFNLFPPMKNCDLIEDSIDHLPISIYNEKIMTKNENQNENENALTNQNSGIFNKIHRKKINKLRKKIKFLVLINQKQSSLQSQSHNLNKQKKIEKYSIIKNKGDNNNEISNTLILKELNEKKIINNYKYKCEHPGCRKSFRTMKLKLNRHDNSNCNCKKDTIALIYMIKNVKKIIKNGKKINNARINRLKKLYKKCIFNLPHKDYAINIAGNDLIN